jgi:hypothetical protein
MLNLSTIFWRTEYCIWIVEWIVWLRAVVGNFKYYVLCLRNCGCNMFMDFGALSEIAWSILHWCMDTQSLGYLSQGLGDLSQGLEYLSQGLGYLSQGLGYLSQGLWRLAYAYIYLWYVCVWCFHDMYIVVLLDVLVCIWVFMDKSIRIFLLASFMI